MIDKKAIIKMAKDVLRRDRGMPDRRLIHPTREWFIGLIGFILIVVAGSVVSAQTFMVYWNIDEAEGEVTAKAPRYNQSDIETALSAYAEKATAFSQYATAEPVTVEPTAEVAFTESEEAEADFETVPTTTTAVGDLQVE